MVWLRIFHFKAQQGLEGLLPNSLTGLRSAGFSASPTVHRIITGVFPLAAGCPHHSVARLPRSEKEKQKEKERPRRVRVPSMPSHISLLP